MPMFHKNYLDALHVHGTDTVECENGDEVPNGVAPGTQKCRLGGIVHGAWERFLRAEGAAAREEAGAEEAGFFDASPAERRAEALRGLFEVGAQIEDAVAARDGRDRTLATDGAVQVVWLGVDEAASAAALERGAGVVPDAGRWLSGLFGGAGAPPPAGGGAGRGGAERPREGEGASGGRNGYASFFENLRATQRNKCWGKVDAPRAEGGEDSCPRALRDAIERDAS